MTEQEIRVKALELTALSLALLPEQDKMELAHTHADLGQNPLLQVQLVIMKNASLFEEKLRHIFDLHG
jgi:hypothetical protein